jgi:hypothetical protein
MGEIQPDRISCVSNTKVVENKIFSTILVKFTDCKMIHEHACRITANEPALAHMWGKNRVETLKQNIASKNLPPEQEAEYCALAEQDLDLEMNLQVDVTLTFDDMTKKVTALDFRGRMLSIRPSMLLR